MGAWRGWVAATILIFGTLPARAALEGPDHTLASLLTGSDADVRYAAIALGKAPGAPVEVYDIAAELLWRGCVNDEPSPDYAVQAWLAIALGGSANARYWDLLADCGDAAYNVKVATQARKAIERLPGGRNIAQYRPAMVDLEAVRQQLAASIARDAARRPEGGLAGLVIGQSMASVYGRYGLPDAVQATAVETKGILAMYGKAGAVTFRAVQGDHGAWVVAGVAPAGAAGSRVAQVRQWLADPDTRQYKRIARELMSHDERDRAVLDELARRIDAGRDTEDSREADGLAWLCKVLGASGDGRYWNFLEEIGETAATFQLRSYAQSSADKLPATDPEPFEPARLRPRKPR